MALIVVGGQAKNVGKTTLICNIISAFVDIKWTAVKVSNHRHATEHSDVLQEGAGWRILQQNPKADHGDTARFLKSGAERALLVQAESDGLREACTALEQEIENAGAVIVESASAAEFVQHDLLLLLLDVAQSDFKVSARKQLDRADAVVIRNSELEIRERVDPLTRKPIFTAHPDGLDPDLFRMVAARLRTSV